MKYIVRGMDSHFTNVLSFAVMKRIKIKQIDVPACQAATSELLKKPGWSLITPPDTG
jgi:hypothetical protein